MKKVLLFVMLIALNGVIAFCQTTATNFTANDCGSASRTLFTELGAGKVVVLVWVMPCGACIGDAKTAFDAQQSFTAAHPGQVLYWMSDDMGNTNCSTLSAWASANAITTSAPGVSLFDNTGITMDQYNYGGVGMPHVVVIGSDHHIYYNQKNGGSTLADIQTAINNALTGNTTTIANTAAAKSQIVLFPNPSKGGTSTLNYGTDHSTNVNVTVYNMMGKSVEAVAIDNQPAGEHTLQLQSGKKLPAGNYFIRLSTDNACETVKFAIVE